MKQLNVWMRVVYGGLTVLAAVLAVMTSGQVAVANALLFFGGAMVVVSIRRQGLRNIWILSGGLLLIHLGALLNGLNGELHIGHQLVRLLLSVAIITVHLKVNRR